jgi:hypothetical protein
MNSIFIESFKRGLLGARPDETLDQARERFVRESEALEFDSASLTEPAPMGKPRTNEQFAEHYRCSVRTICRMKALGIDLGDAVAVTVHLVNQQKVSVPSLERAAELLEDIS